MIILKENTLLEIESNEVIFKEEINIINSRIEDLKRILINSNNKFDKTCSTFDNTSKSIISNTTNDFLANELTSIRMELKSYQEEINTLKYEIKFKDYKIVQLESDLKEKVSQYEERILFLASEIRNLSNNVNLPKIRIPKF